MANYFLLEEAVGSIEAGPDQQDRLDELTGRLTQGDFYVRTPFAVPRQCIDGRPGAQEIGPNTAGGTESLMVADDLTNKRFAMRDGATVSAYYRTLEHVSTQGFSVGGHTDEFAADARSGCGANDRLADVYAFIAQRGELLRTLAAAIGTTPSDDVHEKIIRNAEERTHFSPGAALLDALRETNGDEAVDVLRGSHREVAAVINLVRGTTLNRPALAAEYGHAYQAFNIDAWSLADAARTVARKEGDVPALIAAMTYYNLATAHVLCGPRMRVIVRGVPV